jgi:predicted  nucleic acid-binding Zn-ribbon protein
MDLLKKIEKLKHRIDKFEQLTEDLNENILSKQKKIDYLKKQIHKNVNKIDEIIKDYNANT